MQLKIEPPFHWKWGPRCARDWQQTLGAGGGRSVCVCTLGCWGGLGGWSAGKTMEGMSPYWKEGTSPLLGLIGVPPKIHAHSKPQK